MQCYYNFTTEEVYDLVGNVTASSGLYLYWQKAQVLINTVIHMANT